MASVTSLLPLLMAEPRFWVELGVGLGGLDILGLLGHLFSGLWGQVTLL